MARNIEI